MYAIFILDKYIKQLWISSVTNVEELNIHALRKGAQIHPSVDEIPRLPSLSSIAECSDNLVNTLILPINPLTIFHGIVSPCFDYVFRLIVNTNTR